MICNCGNNEFTTTATMSCSVRITGNYDLIDENELQAAMNEINFSGPYVCTKCQKNHAFLVQEPDDEDEFEEFERIDDFEQYSLFEDDENVVL